MNVVVTILASFLVDQMGRKVLLVRGTAMMMISVLVLSVSLLFLDWIQWLQSILCVLMVFVYVVGKKKEEEMSHVCHPSAVRH